jgi:hypothetical protein
MIAAKTHSASLPEINERRIATDVRSVMMRLMNTTIAGSLILHEVLGKLEESFLTRLISDSTLSSVIVRMTDTVDRFSKLDIYFGHIFWARLFYWVFVII